MIGLAHRGHRLNDYGQHLVHALRDARLLVGADRRAARLRGPGDPGLRPRRRRRLLARRGGRAGRAGAAARRAARAVLPLGRLLRDPPRVLRADLGARRPVLASRRTTSPTPRAPGATWRRSRPARARSTRGSGPCWRGLDERGLADNTIVILTTDHGLPFPGAKATLYDRGIGVMLIVRGPGGFHGGRVSDALVSQIDLYPTLCELAGVEQPDCLQGRSLLPLVRGRGDRGPRRAVRRADLPRRLRAAAGDPHAALQVHPPLRRPARAGAAQRRRRPEQGRCWSSTAGRSARRARGSSTTSSSTPHEAANAPGTPPTPTCSTTCASAWSGGCATRTTRCSTGRWSRRRGRCSTRPTSARPPIRRRRGSPRPTARRFTDRRPSAPAPGRPGRRRPSGSPCPGSTRSWASGRRSRASSAIASGCSAVLVGPQEQDGDVDQAVGVEEVGVAARRPAAGGARPRAGAVGVAAEVGEGVADEVAGGGVAARAEPLAGGRAEGEPGAVGERAVEAGDGGGARSPS